MQKNIFNTENKIRNFFKDYLIFHTVIFWYLISFIIFKKIYTAVPYVTSNDRR